LRGKRESSRNEDLDKVFWEMGLGCRGGDGLRWVLS